MAEAKTHLLFAFIFLIPYLLPQIVPRKIFAAFVGATFLAASYIFYEVHKVPVHERWDGLGGAFTLGLYYLVGFGVFLGIVVRAASYVLAQRGMQKKYYWYLLIATPVLFGIYNYAPGIYSDWERRAPSSVCSYEAAHLSLGKTIIDAPTLPIISAALDDGNGDSEEIDVLYFQSNESLRRYCTKADNGKFRLPVNALSINLYNIERERAHNKRLKAVCEKGSYSFCGTEKYFGVVPYIENLALYYDGHYNADKMYGGTGDTLIDELKAGASDEIYFKYNFIKIEGLRRQNGNAVTFRCREASTNLFCQTNVPFSGDVRLITGYMVSRKATEDDLRKLYNDTYDFLDSMSVSEVSNGRPH